jgi:hypothetical protein
MKKKWLFVINKTEQHAEVQWLDSQGRGYKSEVIFKKGPFPGDDFNYSAIVKTIESYKYGTGDYFNANGEILDFMGHVLSHSSKS